MVGSCGFEVRISINSRLGLKPHPLSCVDKEGAGIRPENGGPARGSHEAVKGDSFADEIPSIENWKQMIKGGESEMAA